MEHPSNVKEAPENDASVVGRRRLEHLGIGVAHQRQVEQGGQRGQQEQQQVGGLVRLQRQRQRQQAIAVQ